MRWKMALIRGRAVIRWHTWYLKYVLLSMGDEGTTDFFICSQHATRAGASSTSTWCYKHSLLRLRSTPHLQSCRPLRAALMHSLSNFNVDCYYNATGGGQGGSNRGPGTLYNIPALLNMATKAWYRQYVNSSAVVPPTSLLGLMSMPKVHAGAKGKVSGGHKAGACGLGMISMYVRRERGKHTGRKVGMYKDVWADIIHPVQGRDVRARNRSTRVWAGDASAGARQGHADRGS